MFVLSKAGDGSLDPCVKVPVSFLDRDYCIPAGRRPSVNDCLPDVE